MMPCFECCSEESLCHSALSVASLVELVYSGLFFMHKTCFPCLLQTFTREITYLENNKFANWNHERASSSPLSELTAPHQAFVAFKRQCGSAVSLIHVADCMTLQKSCNKSLIILFPGAQLSDPAAWHLPHVCWRALWLCGPCRPLLLAAPQICCFHLKNGREDN